MYKQQKVRRLQTKHHVDPACPLPLPVCPSTDFVESKIEEFLVSFGEKMTNLTEEGFQTQVTALIKLKECEDTHLGEEVDRNWFEVVTQQYVFDRLNKEVGRTGALPEGTYFWVANCILCW